MTAPKHLWSGDWEDESAAAAASARADRRPMPPPDPTPDAPTAPPARMPSPAVTPPQTATPRSQPPRRPRRRLSRRSVIGLGVALVIAAAAVGIVAALGSNGPGSTPPAIASANGPPGVRWLGMQITTVAPGEAVIETVALGSQGDRAGLEPGNVILEVNNRPVSNAGDIARAIKGLRSGDRVQLEVGNGSSSHETEAILRAPPTAYP
jgi:S1-C subfamily serine protease